MRKITLFVLMAVCVVVLMTTESCKAEEKTDVAPGKGTEESEGDKPIRRGRQNRHRRPGHGDEQPGQADEPGEGRPRHGRRNRHHNKDRNKNKPQEEDSESFPGAEE